MLKHKDITSVIDSLLHSLHIHWFMDSQSVKAWKFPPLVFPTQTQIQSVNTTVSMFSQTPTVSPVSPLNRELREYPDRLLVGGSMLVLGKEGSLSIL